MSDVSTALAHVESSNLPTREKSALRRWFEHHGGHHLAHRVKGHVTETGHVLRCSGEGLIVGGVLGAASAMLPHGLDYKIGPDKIGGFTNPGVPLDAAAGVAAAAGAVAMAHEPVAATLRNGAAVAFGVFGFRKVEAFVKARHAASAAGAPATAHGEFGSESAIGEDPIVAAAQRL